MFLRRRDLMTGALGAALSLISGGASAADIPKLKCTRVGQTVIFRNKKFTCIKKGGKLVWNKGVPIPVKSSTPKPTPSASASASATPSASASASATPTATPTETASPAPSLSKNAIKLANSSEIPTDSVKVFQAGRTPGLMVSIVLIRDNAGLRALQAECPHAGYLVKDNGSSQLICQAHNSLFSAKDGELLRGPANRGLSSYVVTETGGEIYLTL